MVQLAVCARVGPHVLVWLKSPASIPVTAMPAILRMALPLLVMVMGSAGLAEPTSRLLKIKLTGDSAIAGAVMPMPVSETVCGLPTQLLVCAKSPLAAMVRLVSGRAALVLVSVTDCGALGEPTGWLA